MTWKSTVLGGFVSGAGLVATWLGVVSMPAPPSNNAVINVAPPSATASAAAADIAQQAARLEQRLRAEAEYREPSRNPFRFRAPIAASRAQLAPRPIAPVTPSEIAALPAAQPRVRLTGIASDDVDGAMQRTAVLTTESGLLLVREGEMAGEFRVVTIDEEAVDLEKADGTRLRLTLRP